jgi:HK97 family phage major capsid protein
MSFAQQLFEKRSKLVEQSRAIVDAADGEKRELSAEEQQTYNRIDEDIRGTDGLLKRELDRHEADKAADAAFRSLEAKPEVRDLPKPELDLRALMVNHGAVEVRSEGQLGEVSWRRRMASAEARALSKGTATAGGNTVKTSFYDQLVDHLIEVSGIMQAGPTVLNTDSGESIQIPTTTAHSSAAIVAEAAAIGASDPAFAQRTLGAYKYGILLQLSTELLTDTSVDLEGYLAMELGRALGNGFGAHAITGTGGGTQPTGVVTSASTGVTGGTGVVGAFTADNLIDLHFSVIAPYRNSKSCAWMMKDSTLGSVRKLKDSAGYYLFSPAATVGAPDTLLGKPIVTDPNVAAPALSAKSVIFGDFSRYFVRMVNGIRLERSTDYAFNTDQVTWRALLRADGITVDQTGALKVFAGGAT